MADSSSLGKWTRTKKQKPVRPGDLVNYVYVDEEQPNPMKRVAPAEFAEGYDAEKYAEMLHVPPQLRPAA